MKQLLPLLLLLFLTLHCTSDRAPETKGELAFFDLASYMDAEVERLTARKVLATKTITLNEETETKEKLAVNYKNDLRLFRNADINKPAWVEKYQTNTENLSAGHTRTTYVTTDSSLVVHRLLVEQDQGVPVRIEIDRKTGSVLSDGLHELVYEPASGYRVKTVQQNRFGDDVDALIEVNWQ